MVFTSGWASGVNAYAVVLLLGVFGATGLFDEAPASLQRTDVLVLGLLALCLLASRIRRFRRGRPPLAVRLTTSGARGGRADGWYG